MVVLPHLQQTYTITLYQVQIVPLLQRTGLARFDYSKRTSSALVVPQLEQFGNDFKTNYCANNFTTPPEFNIY
jgi:hypothetical protein